MKISNKYFYFRISCSATNYVVPFFFDVDGDSIAFRFHKLFALLVIRPQG